MPQGYKLGACPPVVRLWFRWSWQTQEVAEEGGGGRSRGRQEAHGSRMWTRGSARGLIWAHIFQRIHWNLSWEVLRNCRALPYLENSSRSEAWAARQQSASGGFLDLHQAGQDPKLIRCTSTTATLSIIFFFAGFARNNKHIVGASAAQQAPLWADLTGKSANLEGKCVGGAESMRDHQSQPQQCEKADIFGRVCGIIWISRKAEVLGVTASQDWVKFQQTQSTRFSVTCLCLIVSSFPASI